MKKVSIYGLILTAVITVCASCEKVYVNEKGEEGEFRRCKAITLKNTRCKRLANEGSDYCWQHQKNRSAEVRQVVQGEYVEN